jgi:hypothetical protein
VEKFYPAWAGFFHGMENPGSLNAKPEQENKKHTKAGQSR